MKSIPSNATATENFHNSWENLVKGTVTVSEAPTLLDSTYENGWEIVSGHAPYTDAANKGVITLLTTTGKDKMANVVLMTNTQKYQQQFESLLSSLELNEAATTNNNNLSLVSANTELAGKIWEAPTLEKHGASYGSMSGFHTGGFWKYQYKFNTDGTYQFVYNAASAVATNPV